MTNFFANILPKNKAITVDNTKVNKSMVPLDAKIKAAAESILEKESGGKQVQGASGEFGLFQFMPATWALVGHKRTNNGFVQVEAGLKYIQRKYGGNICKALGSNLSRGWY